MNRAIFVWSMASAITLSTAVYAESGMATKVTPAIPGYGAVDALPDGKAIFSPSSHDSPKIIYTVTHASESPGKLNPDLERVARAVNLYVAGGVPLDHLKIVVIAREEGTLSLLDNSHYRARFSTDNPNLQLLGLLHSAGVEVVAGEQSMHKAGIESSWLASDVAVVLSATTAYEALTQKGYVLFPA